MELLLVHCSTYVYAVLPLIRNEVLATEAWQDNHYIRCGRNATTNVYVTLV